MMKMREPTSNDELDAVFEKFAGSHKMLKTGTLSRADLALAFKSFNEVLDDNEVDEIFDAAGLTGNTGMTKSVFREIFQSCDVPIH